MFIWTRGNTYRYLFCRQAVLAGRLHRDVFRVSGTWHSGLLDSACHGVGHDLIRLVFLPPICIQPNIRTAPWSLAKIWDLAKHLVLPVVILGTAGTATLVRIMRANLTRRVEEALCHYGARQGTD